MPSTSTQPQLSLRHATIPALHLRDARDAHIVFEAVRQNVLPLITKRLSATERDQVESGNVFVWEEAEHKQGGLERWTDGRRWSQSRMRGDYLFYEEKIETTPEEKAAKAARRARRTLDPFSYQPTPTRQDRPSKPDGLTKQTYSTHVYTSQAEPRKWHIVAYFSGDDYTRLPVVEDYDFLRNLRLPDGVFASPRATTSTRIARPLGPDASNSSSSAHWGRDPWGLPSSPSSPSASQVSSPIDRPESSSSSSSSTSLSNSSTSSSLSSSTTASTTSSASSSPPHGSSFKTLPRLSNIVPIHPLSPPLSHRVSAGGSGSSSSGGGYAALTSEDRRALNSFRVVL
ncbi:uncharacterized protein FIBRA_06314 [Fibroporia radiculosa]|uniref:cAMP-independent regulatory protein pac2 n=1 Tax=Fibroporia radiculosa TaxID=599839 RepID=J4HYX2_9APHY|nr:uncharacterized protein FIBRA_06314 [Fibroporia radiculosa]CCM04152.1 predicted protein [Fibroporia radiculosa]